jgi:hypothetical protein
MQLTLVSRILLIIYLVLLPLQAFSADLWYEDNNLGRAGGLPTDFFTKFEHPESFAQASRYIDVYMVRASLFNKMQDDFVTKIFVPYLNQYNIQLAADVVGATWSQAEGRGGVSASELKMLARLEGLDVRIDYVSMQSVLSKPLKVAGKHIDYSLQQRISDVVAYARAIRAIYPQVQIGIVDALPTHGQEYKLPYRKLRDALAQESIPLAFIHLDIPFDIPRERKAGITWTTVREVERYIENDLGVKFGLVASSRLGGETSRREFHRRVLAAMECYTGSGGTPDDFIIASWYPYPDRTVSDDSVAGDYPAMRTVLEFGRKLEQIEKAGASWATLRASQPDWQNMCGTAAAQ